MVSFRSLLLEPNDGHLDSYIKKAIADYVSTIDDYQYHHLVVGFLLYPRIEVFLSGDRGTLSYAEHEEQPSNITIYDPECYNEDGESVDFYLTGNLDKPMPADLEYTLPKEVIINALTHFAEHKKMPPGLFFKDVDFDEVVRSRQLSDYIFGTM